MTIHNTFLTFVDAEGCARRVSVSDVLTSGPPLDPLTDEPMDLMDDDLETESDFVPAWMKK